MTYATQKATRKAPRTAKEGPGGLRIGMVVYDSACEMVGTIDEFMGPLVHLSRPTGLTWQSRWVSLRQGTAYERRQLRAIGALHRQRRKGFPA
ncbi:hypothetical protein [Streptomyces sp. AK02-01A]|uniref:hypothetical protein n=1 Tax=Streptomyces sp. AK02-01A TaxID=3028648 RepID=UPI0029B3C880|nr:hypothetical protein [Streptomyces sp. AK02-01A]MDX3850303.1 hypothetical protein [Streptomyces sp. AK02-01A]